MLLYCSSYEKLLPFRLIASPTNLFMVPRNGQTVTGSSRHIMHILTNMYIFVNAGIKVSSQNDVIRRYHPSSAEAREGHKKEIEYHRKSTPKFKNQKTL